MRIFAFVILAFAAVSSAISVPGLPSCASSCVSTDFGGCGSLNVTCICSNQPLIDNLACCVSKVCSTTDQATTIQFADALCQGSGIDTLPKSATCAAGAQSTIAGASGTSSTLSATGTIAAAVSSASSAAFSASTSASAASASSGSTTASSGSTSRTASASQSSASASATKNSAPQVQVAAMKIGALLVGAVAAL